MKHNRYILIIILFLSSLTACDLDINENPNIATESNVTGELIFPAAANSVGQRAASGNFTFINNWLGYWAGSGTFAIDQTETTYNITTSFGNAIWQNHYGVLFDLEQTRLKSKASNPPLAGAAIVLSVKLYQELVDMYGNIPYSQAFKFGEYKQPVYDDAKTIYSDLQVQLDTAIALLGNPSTSSFKSVDIINKGDNEKWIKFANTLKLRLLIRQSETSGFDPSAEIAKIISNGGVLHAGESVYVNPGYEKATNKQSPFYGNYGLTPSDAEANPAVRANAYFVDLLNSSSDARVERYFNAPTAGGDITGCVYGLSAGNPDGSHSSAIGEGLVKSPSQDQWIFTSTESLFLEAEAIARGWMPGDEQTAYEDAVKDSFVWLGVTDATTEATTYLTNQSIANFSNAGSTPSSKAKFIAYQKYIALCGTDPLEVWSDLRRLNMIPNTGYLSVNPGSTTTFIPVRLLYANSEYTTNADNVGKQGNINQFTSKIFWQP